MTRRNGLILMTGLPPHVGHKYLIEFAKRFILANNISNGYPNRLEDLEVLLNTRNCEPLEGNIRWLALNDLNTAKIIEYADDNTPQNPEDHPDFWNWWKNCIRRATSNKPGDFIFASEKYGHKLAEVLECEFVPCDVEREIINISGTKIRYNPIVNFDLMLPRIQKHYRKTVTIFGPESVGKTTIYSRLMARLYYSELTSIDRVPEFARGYLEEVGPEITMEKMHNIVCGQFAMQRNAAEMIDCPFIVQDTDLLSTLGYYDLWKGEHPAFVENMFLQTKADIYILMNDQIPFEPDPLRYGGDKRESDNNFWRNLLNKYKCNYHEVKSLDILDQIEEIDAVLEKLFLDNCGIYGYIRD